MANTLPNITLPKGTWVDLYGATRIIVGIRIIIHNLSSRNVRLVSKATEPNSADGYVIVRPYEEYVNEAGDLGAWAMCHLDGLVNVRVA